MTKYKLLSVFLFLPLLAFGQSGESLVDTFNMLTEKMLFGADEEIRNNACNRCDSLLYQYIVENKADIAFLDSTKGLASVRTPDGTTRIITGQCFKNEDSYTYFGYIISHNSITRLTDKSSEIRRYRDVSLPPNRWYGAIYYDLQVLNDENILLFGYDAYSKFRRRKIIDVLSPKGNSWIFGKPIFNIPSDPDIMRFVLEYASESKVGLKYDPMREMILYDNLIPLEGMYEGQGTVMVPDGSYSAFTIKNGALEWKEKAYNRSSSTPLSEN